MSVVGEPYRVPDGVHRGEAAEPPGRYRGPVRLADGREVVGLRDPRELAEGAGTGTSPLTAAGAPIARRPASAAQG